MFLSSYLPGAVFSDFKVFCKALVSPGLQLVSGAEGRLPPPLLWEKGLYSPAPPKRASAPAHSEAGASFLPSLSSAAAANPSAVPHCLRMGLDTCNLGCSGPGLPWVSRMQNSSIFLEIQPSLGPLASFPLDLQCLSSGVLGSFQRRPGLAVTGFGGAGGCGQGAGLVGRGGVISAVQPRQPFRGLTLFFMKHRTLSLKIPWK